jgi:hypothetical protein
MPVTNRAFLEKMNILQLSLKSATKTHDAGHSSMSNQFGHVRLITSATAIDVPGNSKSLSYLCATWELFAEERRSLKLLFQLTKLHNMPNDTRTFCVDLRKLVIGFSSN